MEEEVLGTLFVSKFGLVFVLNFSYLGGFFVFGGRDELGEGGVEREYIFRFLG